IVDLLERIGKMERVGCGRCGSRADSVEKKTWVPTPVGPGTVVAGPVGAPRGRRENPGRSMGAGPPPMIPHDTRPSYQRTVEEKVGAVGGSGGSSKSWAVAAAASGGERSFSVVVGKKKKKAGK